MRRSALSGASFDLYSATYKSLSCKRMPKHIQTASTATAVCTMVALSSPRSWRFLAAWSDARLMRGADYGYDAPYALAFLGFCTVATGLYLTIFWRPPARNSSFPNREGPVQLPR
jgi:hypothetical protein